MTTLQNAAGHVLINGLQYAKGTVAMIPVGASGEHVIIVYTSNGGLALGLTSYIDFRLLPGNTAFASRAALLAWADANIYQVGGDPGAGSRFVTLIVINGESNSGGQAHNSELTAEELAERPAVQILNNTTLEWEPLHIGVNNSLGHNGPFGALNTATTHGWENGLAYTVEEGLWYRDEIYLVKTGQGGCTIAQLTGSTYFPPFVDRVQAAHALLKAAGKIPITILEYTQGINDDVAGTVMATWKAATITHLKKLRSYLGFVPIVIPYFMTGFEDYNAIFDEIAAELPFTFMVSSAGATLDDGYHWDRDGMELIQRNMAAKIIDVIGQDEAYMLSQAYALSTIEPAAGGGGGATYTEVDRQTFDGVDPLTWSVLAAGGSNSAGLDAADGSIKLHIIWTQAYSVAFAQGLFTPGTDKLRVTVKGVHVISGDPHIYIGSDPGSEFSESLVDGDNNVFLVDTTTFPGGANYIILTGPQGTATATEFFAGEIIVEVQN